MVNAYHLGMEKRTDLTGFRMASYGDLSTTAPAYGALVVGAGAGWANFQISAGKTFRVTLMLISNYSTSARGVYLFYDDDGAGTNIASVVQIYIEGAVSTSAPNHILLRPNVTIPAQKYVKAGAGGANINMIIWGFEE